MDEFFQILREKTIVDQKIEKSKEKTYEKYFNKTLQLKDIDKNHNLIQELNKKGESVGRKFYNKNLELKYEERFVSNILQAFIQISPNITFIFPPGVNKLSGIIAYRFYSTNPKNLPKTFSYFTLVLKHDRKYEILEKNSSIKDANNEPFIEENLNCLDIMIKIIKGKFSSDINFQFPHSKIEILGFIYSAMNEDFGNFKLIEPFYPSPLNENSKLENLDKNNKDINYIEPILFNEHISIFLVAFKGSERNNLLIDPSLYHYDIINKDSGTFPRSMRWFLTSPNTKIQSGPCCSIWFIGQILSFLDSKKNNQELKKINNIIDTVNKINELMNKEKVIYFKDCNYSEPKNLINISCDDKYFVSHRLLFCPFLDINGFTYLTNLIDYKYVNFAGKLKLKLDSVRLEINNLENNKKYYELSHQNFNINIDSIKSNYIDALGDYNLYILDIKKMESKYDSLINLEERRNLYDKQKLIEEKIDKIMPTKEMIECQTVKGIYDDERMRKIYLEGNDVLTLLNN